MRLEQTSTVVLEDDSRPSVEDDKAMVTLGLSVFLSLLITAGIMFSGAVFHALFMVYASIPVFVVAFVTAPLLARLPLRNWSTRGAALGALLGWMLSAPIAALLYMPVNAMYELEDPFEFLPGTWLWALVPLAASLVVAGIRQYRFGQDRHQRVLLRG